MVWSVDGLDQFYPFFVFEGDWLRSIAGNLASGHGLVIPMWSNSLGYGADVVAELDVLFDPLNLLSGLCPPQLSEYLFQFLVVFRLFLAGAAFSLFAFRFGTGRFSTLLGALLYALSGTALVVSFWPASAWPLVLFPLALLGVEKIIAGERPLLFILTMAAFFIISYYFSYMACLFLLPYCAARVILVRRPGPGRFLLWALRFAGYLAVGILIAAIALVPLLTELSKNQRFVDVETTVPLLYSLPFYVKAVSGFLSTANVGSDCYIGYGPVALLACMLLFFQRRRNRLLKLAFVACAVILFVPLLGSVFNGFNYATNRWVWAFSLLVCFIVAKMLPDLLKASTGQAKKLALAAIVFCAFVAFLPAARTEKTIAACVVLAATLFVVAQRGLTIRTRRLGMATCLVAGLVCNTFYYVSPEEGGMGAGNPRIGSLYDKLTDESSNSLVKSLDDPTPWRYDADPETPARPRNDSLVLGLPGIDFYNSFYNSYIDAYHTELGVAGTKINFSYTNAGARSILDTLSGVKYFLAPDGVAPPYNFRSDQGPIAHGEVRGKGLDVYQAQNPLPLAYVYDSAIPRSVYQGLTQIQRQEALLQGVVLDDADAAALPTTSLELQSQAMPAKITPGPGLSLKDGVVRVLVPGAKITLAFDGLPDSETYLSFKNLRFRGLSPEEAAGPGFETEPWYLKLATFRKGLDWTAPLDYDVWASSDKGTANRLISNSTRFNHLFGGKRDWLANLGYSKAAQSSITVSFSTPGEYSFDSMQALCQPMGRFDERVDKLKSTPVRDVSWSTNRFSAQVDTDRRQALFLSIPYSQGWSATVDGQPADLKRANTGFMALELQPGQHRIELSYRTPGLKEGALGSAAGLLVLVLIIGGREAYQRRRGCRPSTKAGL